MRTRGITFEEATPQQLERLLGLVDGMKGNILFGFYRWATDIHSLYGVLDIDEIMNHLE
jgi:hypothetical protein